MITGPLDHKLHVILSRNLPTSFFYYKILYISNSALIFIITTMNSSLYHLIIITTSSFLYQLGYQLTLAFSRKKDLCVTYKPLQIK